MKTRLAFPLIAAAFGLFSHPLVAQDASSPSATAVVQWMSDIATTKLVDDLLADQRIRGELRQKAMAIKAQCLVMSDRPDEARRVFHELVVLDPNSKTAKMMSKELEVMIESSRALKQAAEEPDKGNETDSEENNYFGTSQP